MKYFSIKHGEGFYPLKYFKNPGKYLKYDEDFEGIEFEGLLLELGKREIGAKHFYCSEFGEIGETGEGCGKECQKYEPRNKKNGRCRFHKNTFEGTGEWFKLQNNRLVKIENK